MKTISFVKMAGAGNDFIVIDAPRERINLKKLAVKMCDRTDGIGADGLLVLDESKKADFKMRIINADGSEAEMCGNGARCMAAYIVRHRKPRQEIFTMETLAGVLDAQADGEVADVRLSPPQDYRPDISVKIDGQKTTIHYIDTGVPHAIVYVDDLSSTDVNHLGRIIRYHDEFKPRGTNANFVEYAQKNLVHCRTYERGVEGETKACGTGSVAAAIVSYLKQNPDVTTKRKASMRVKTRSGEVLRVTFDLADGVISNVHLKGSAKFIAKGEYYL